MLKVYSSQGSGNCYKVRLLLKQVGIPFETVEMDVVKGDQRQPEFLVKNPNGRVPLVEFPDGRTLPESGAILYHFSQGTPLWPDDLDEQTRALQWMFFEQYSHEPNIAVARFYCYYLDAEEKYKKLVERKREGGYRALGVMEQHLVDNAFFVGERYTIADIALYAYTHVAHQGGFSLEDYPAIRAWLDRVAGQPGHIPITEECQ